VKLETVAQYVADAVGFLFAGYPGATRGWDPEKHREVVKVYGAVLTRIPRECVADVIRRAHSTHQKWAPTVGELGEIANLSHADWQRNSARPPTPPDRQLPERIIPTRDGREAYVQAGGTDFEKLARLWECESRELQLQPNNPCPQEVGGRRMRQLGKILDRVKSGPLAGAVSEAVAS